MTPAHHPRLFREVNDRIYDLLESAEPDLPGEFLCECGRECEQRVMLLPAAFAALRRGGGGGPAPGFGGHTRPFRRPRGWGPGGRAPSSQRLHASPAAP